MDKTIVKNITCPLCDKIYLKKGSLNLHLKKFHKYSSTEASLYCKNLNVTTESEVKWKASNEATNLKRYGCTNVYAAKAIKDKIKETCLEKYGVTTPGQAEEVKAKIKQTFIDKYGGHPFTNEEVKAKITETMIERYGVDNPAKSEEIFDRRKATNLERYGHEHSLSSPEIQAKITATCQEKYGVNRPGGIDEIKVKIKASHLEHYGCWYPQTDAHHRSNHQWKPYVLPSGKVVKVQGYEPQALDILLRTYDESDLLISLSDLTAGIGPIWYSLSDEDHRYFPDIFIISEQKFIEVKSQYTFAQHRERNLAKKNRCLEMGYQFEFMVFDNFRNCPEIY